MIMAYSQCAQFINKGGCQLNWMALIKSLDNSKMWSVGTCAGTVWVFEDGSSVLNQDRVLTVATIDFEYKMLFAPSGIYIELLFDDMPPCYAHRLANGNWCRALKHNGSHNVLKSPTSWKAITKVMNDKLQSEIDNELDSNS